jgi:diguanylate cyclase (GGDEF)-like protein/PAS domain S-box-containing protein
LLITPLLIGERSIGQISADDPQDGARPTKEKLRGLEELASVAAIALRETHSMERTSEQHKLFHFLSENTVSGLAITQAERFCYLNDHVVELLGYPREELLTLTPWWQVINREDRKIMLRNDGSSLQGTFRVRAIRKDENIVWLELQCQPMEYQGQAAILLNLLDISDRVQTEALLKEKALRDPLTDLFNRHYFEETIQTELKRSLRYKRPLTLMMTDLAGFKRVNDQLGHQRGDQALHEVARVIQKQLRESDWAIRYGGDEFLIVLPETGARVETLAQRLHSAVEQWAADHLPEVPLGIDVGWATWTPESDLSVTQLLQQADAKMYEEKVKR